MPSKDNHPIADQFSDEEMEQLKRYGQAMGGSTPFSDEVEQALPKYEAHYAKMREASSKKMQAARTGGSPGDLGPSEMEQTAAKQQGAIQQQASAMGTVQAAKAQAAQVPSAPPPAPGGPVGETKPYAAQREETPPGIPEEEAPEAPGGKA